MTITCLSSLSSRRSLLPPFLLGLSSSSLSLKNSQFRKFNCIRERKIGRSRGRILCGLLPVDPWAPTIDSESIAPSLFAFSLFPYVGFLYFITISKSAPKLTLFGFYFLLAFVGATVPAGIYAKVHYGTSLSNVDWLHGGAESLLTLSNLFVVLGLRKALRDSRDSKQSTSDVISGFNEEKPPT